MSAKNVCNKENIRSKKYAPASDDVDANQYPQCPSPSLDEGKRTPEPNKCDEIGEDEIGCNDKKKFVEAPLPKVNPWTANLNAAHVVRAKDPAKEKDPVVGEKRVLQPQQQTVCEYR